MKEKKSNLKIDKNGVFYTEDESNNLKVGFGDSCCICMGIPKQGQITPCNHIFCMECLNEWLSLSLYEKTCPICRNKFDFLEILQFTNQSNFSNSKNTSYRTNLTTHRRQFGAILLCEERITHLNFRSALNLGILISIVFLSIGYLLG